MILIVIWFIRRRASTTPEKRPLLSVQSEQPDESEKFEQALILEKLGSGGSGMEIFRCSVAGMSCAVKVMDLSLFDEKQHSEFIREINVLMEASKRSQFVVKYLHHIVTERECRLFMEYFPTTLQHQIAQLRKEKRSFSRAAIAGVCRRLLRGLASLHGDSGHAPIIHRDLKSANIFAAFDRFGSPVELKIGDFGISKLVHTRHQARTYVGTPGFMAPEVLQGKPYNTSADIWSFGATLYECITLHPPFSDCQWDSERDAKVIAGETPNFDIVDGSLVSFVAIVKECMSMDPEKRPNAEELLKRQIFEIPKGKQ